MRKIDPRLVLAIAAAGLVMALWLVLMSVIVWSTLDAQERLAVGDVLAPRTVPPFSLCTNAALMALKSKPQCSGNF